MKYIITGTSSGLGFSLASKLIECGEVAGISRTIGKSISIVDNKNFLFFDYDLSLNANEDNFQSLLNKLINFIDDEPFILILNAASFYSNQKRMEYTDISMLFDTNVFSIFKLVESLTLKKLKRILIINSISGLVGQINQHEYSASKHAVMGFVKSLIKTSKNEAYDVMCINPGGMKTELWKTYDGVDTSDFLNPENIADLCIKLIHFPQRVFIESIAIIPPSDI